MEKERKCKEKTPFYGDLLDFVFIFFLSSMFILYASPYFWTDLGLDWLGFCFAVVFARSYFFWVVGSLSFLASFHSLPGRFGSFTRGFMSDALCFCLWEGLFLLFSFLVVFCVTPFLPVPFSYSRD